MHKYTIYTSSKERWLRKIIPDQGPEAYEAIELQRYFS